MVKKMSKNKRKQFPKKSIKTSKNNITKKSKRKIVLYIINKQGFKKSNI